MKSKFIFVALLFTIITFSQQKRKPFTLEIAANENQQYKAEIPESPYFVKDKILQIYCGEKVYVECEIVGDTISEMKIVEKNVNPKRTIEIEFSQDSNDRKNINTMLQIKNPFEKDLVYEAIMLTPRSEECRKTSTIPVRANLLSFETWPHSIISLVLENWKFKNK